MTSLDQLIDQVEAAIAAHHRGETAPFSARLLGAVHEELDHMNLGRVRSHLRAFRAGLAGCVKRAGQSADGRRICSAQSASAPRLKSAASIPLRNH